MNKLTSLLTLCAVLCACDKQLPTATDARAAVKHVCLATAVLDGATPGGLEKLEKLEKLCADPVLQAKLLKVIQEATELAGAVKEVLPPAAQPLAEDAGAP